MKNKECRGCEGYRSNYELCTFGKYNKQELCPCTICLVKVMCKVWCRDYFEMRNEVVDIPIINHKIDKPRKNT